MSDLLLEAREVSKSYAGVDALRGVSLRISAGQVTCLLGDNGAGKSTLVKILSGVHSPTSGTLCLDGKTMTLRSPREALAHGIATVHQDLAIVPLMSVWRNFFLGSEPTLGGGLARRLDVRRCRITAREELARIGIEIRDTEQVAATLSGGQRQSLAVARAVYFGARVLVLDEPTAALGVRQSRRVLGDIAGARDRGVGVVFVTHNPHHAYPIGDRFVVLRRGELIADRPKSDLSLDQLGALMGGN